MSKINNSGLDQYGAQLFEQQQFGTSGVEGVKMTKNLDLLFRDLNANSRYFKIV